MLPADVRQVMHANMLRHREAVHFLSPWTLARLARLPSQHATVWGWTLAMDPCLGEPWQPVRALNGSGIWVSSAGKAKRQESGAAMQNNLPHRVPPASRTPVAPRLTALRRLTRFWCTLSAAPDCSLTLPVPAPAGREGPLASLRMLLAAPLRPAAGTCSFSPAPCQHHEVRCR